MDYFEGTLKEKIAEMYPEIGEHGLSVTVSFDHQKNAYLITFDRNGETLSTRLEKKDAHDCMRGIQCVYLGVQIAQFIRNFEDREVFGRLAA